MARRDLSVADDCLLALAGLDPETAAPEARAGARLVTEFLATFQALVKGLSKKT